MRRATRPRAGRRAFLAAATILVVAIAGFVTWRVLHPGVHPKRFGVRLVHFTIRSRLVGEDLPQLGILLPPLPHGPRPLLVLPEARQVLCPREESNLRHTV